MAVDNKGLEVNLNHQLEDLALHQGLPVETKTNVSAADNLVILTKIVLRRTLLQIKCNKGCPHHYEDDSAEEEVAAYETVVKLSVPSKQI